MDDQRRCLSASLWGWARSGGRSVDNDTNTTAFVQKKLHARLKNAADSDEWEVNTCGSMKKNSCSVLFHIIPLFLLSFSNTLPDKVDYKKKNTPS